MASTIKHNICISYHGDSDYDEGGVVGSSGDEEED